MHNTINSTYSSAGFLFHEKLYDGRPNTIVSFVVGKMFNFIKYWNFGNLNCLKIIQKQQNI